MSSKARKELKIDGGTSPHRQLFTPPTPELPIQHMGEPRTGKNPGKNPFNESTVNIPQSLWSFFLENLKRMAGLGRAGQRRTL